MDLVYRNIDLGVTGQVVSARSCALTGYFIFNAASATAFVKLYNKATAATTSDTPVITIALPAGGGANVFGNPGIGGSGVHFSSGLSVRACMGVADNNNTAPGTNEVIVNLFYR